MHSILIIGATGMVGGLVLREALGRSDVARGVVLTRRPCGLAHPKLTEILHDDFTDFRDVAEHLRRHDAAIYCLGAYTGAVPDDELRRVTVDMPVTFAAAFHAESPDAAFCFLSGQGADQSGRSRIPFARYKGMAECALLGLGFRRLHIMRPGYIHSVERRREPNLAYDLMRALYPLVRRLYPNIGVPSDALARVMLEAALHGTGSHVSPVLENRDIRRMAERLGS